MLSRELAGLFEAMDFFNQKDGVIITRDQSDIFTEADKTIKVIPFYQWATEKLALSFKWLSVKF